MSNSSNESETDAPSYAVIYYTQGRCHIQWFENLQDARAFSTSLEVTPRIIFQRRGSETIEYSGPVSEEAKWRKCLKSFATSWRFTLIVDVRLSLSKSAQENVFIEPFDVDVYCDVNGHCLN